MTFMYDKAASWNAFKGCDFDCVYCGPSFQRQSKRWGKNNCQGCYDYNPHEHPERLETTKIPSEKIIFVVGSGDITFCATPFVKRIIDVIKEHNKNCPYKTYYFQSKNPKTFNRFKDYLPKNCILLTTLETDLHSYSDGSFYSDYSKAPEPLTRYHQFKSIDYPRKVVTVEPLFEFSPEFSYLIKKIYPEYVWIGFNSRPNEVKLPEPTEDEVKHSLIEPLWSAELEVRGKELRGLTEWFKEREADG